MKHDQIKVKKRHFYHFQVTKNLLSLQAKQMKGCTLKLYSQLFIVIILLL